MIFATARVKHSQHSQCRSRHGVQQNMGARAHVDAFFVQFCVPASVSVFIAITGRSWRCPVRYFHRDEDSFWLLTGRCGLREIYRFLFCMSVCALWALDFCTFWDKNRQQRTKLWDKMRFPADFGRRLLAFFSDSFFFFYSDIYSSQVRCLRIRTPYLALLQFPPNFLVVHQVVQIRNSGCLVSYTLEEMPSFGSYLPIST